MNLGHSDQKGKNAQLQGQIAHKDLSRVRME